MYFLLSPSVYFIFFISYTLLYIIYIQFKIAAPVPYHI